MIRYDLMIFTDLAIISSRRCEISNAGNEIENVSDKIEFNPIYFLVLKG